MSDTALACDGPLNGQYITAAQAAEHGYELCSWTHAHDEKVYMQAIIREMQGEGLVNRHGQLNV